MQKKNRKIVIRISNNGTPLEKGEIIYNHGLNNIVQRLKLLHKDNYSFTMTNIGENEGVLTKIILPSTK